MLQGLERTMPHLGLRDGLLLDVMLAPITHVVYKTYEPDATLFVIHVFYLALVPLLPATLIVPTPSFSLATICFISFAVFYTALLTSIVVYRLSPFHPLSRYPGPLIARVSMLWTAYTIWTGKVHEYRKALHDKYGVIVRTGPNELSIVDPSLIPAVLGADGMPKGPGWTGREPVNQSLIAMRDLHQHASRRKRWNRAFSMPSVKGYEPILWKRATQLVDVLDIQMNKENGKLDLHRWLSYFTTDFMGDMAFGGGFEFMRDGKDTDGLWAMISSEIHFQSLMQSFAWLSSLVQRLAFNNNGAPAFRQFALSKAVARKKNGSLSKDLFYHLIDEGGVSKSPPPDHEVIMDGGLAIIAGADTTSSVLSGAFRYILEDRNVYERLQKEIEEVFPRGEGEPFDASKLGKMPFLDAVINETLRLQPAVPTFLLRAPEMGSGGKWIGDHWLPEKTAIDVSPYVLHRSPRNFFPSPDTFWPDRWILAASPPSPSHSPSCESQPSASLPADFVHDTSAFIPFSYGPANCVGKPLAMLEMRMIIAILMQKFEFRFEEGYKAGRWDEELVDVMVFETGELPVIIESRKSK